LHRPTNPGLIYLPLLCLLLLAACDEQAKLVEVRILQFGTVIDVSLVHEDPAAAEQSLSDIEKQLAEYRQNWHAWEESDLSRFNRSLASSQAVTIPASLTELISLSQYYYIKSNQLFNPALGKLINAYGFHGSVEPDQATISSIQKNMPSMSDLQIKGQLATSNNEHLQLDFGGIAKGYAVGLIADQLRQQGYDNFLISAGGDIVTSGNKFGKAWRVGVQNPFETGAIASIDLLGQHSIFTSGDYQRFYSKDNHKIHHIIDPRSGNPSEQISSATVLTTDPVLADVSATTLMIDGLENSRSLSLSLGIDDYMIVSEDREITISRSFADKLKITGDWPIYIID